MSKTFRHNKTSYGFYYTIGGLGVLNILPVQFSISRGLFWCLKNILICLLVVQRNP